MICKKCGYENDENTKFCSHCGEPIEPVVLETEEAAVEEAAEEAVEETAVEEPVEEAAVEEPAEEPVEETAEEEAAEEPVEETAEESVEEAVEETPKKKKKTGIIVAVVLLIAALAGGIFAYNAGGRSPEETVSIMMEASFKGDLKAMSEIIPEKVFAEQMKEMGYDSVDAAMKEFEKNKALLEEMMKQIDIDYKISEIKDIPKESLKDLQKSYEKYDLKVKAAKSATVKIKAELFGQTSEEDNTIVIVKIGRDWYANVVE